MGTIRHPLAETRSDGPPDITLPAPLRVPRVPTENLTFSSVPELVDPQAFRPSKSRPRYKKSSAVNSTISSLYKSFRRPFQNKGRTARAPDENLISVDAGQIPQTAEGTSPPHNPTANEDYVQQNQPLLPPDCRRLCPEEVDIADYHPPRGGLFAEVWDGYLDGDRVVIKSYRTYSTVDSTPARMVRFLRT